MLGNATMKVLKQDEQVSKFCRASIPSKKVLPLHCPYLLLWGQSIARIFCFGGNALPRRFCLGWFFFFLQKKLRAEAKLRLPREEVSEQYALPLVAISN